MATKPQGHVNWSGFALLTAGIWAVAVVILAAGWLDGGALPLALVALGSVMATLVLAAFASRQRRLHMAKLSSDLTIVAARLLQAEAREPAKPSGEVQWSASVTRDLAADFELLGRVVTELAETVGEHHRQLDALATRPAPSIALPAAIPDPKPSERFDLANLSTREDFARAASAILKKLTPEPEADPAPLPANPAPRPTSASARPAATRSASLAPAAGGELEADVLDALSQGRIEVHLQPVVTLPQRRTRFYEALGRLRVADGTLIQPPDFLPILEQNGRLPELDGFMLARAFAIGRHLASRDSGASVSCNLSPLSLAHRIFFGAAEELYESDRVAARRVLLEIRHRDLDLLSSSESAALARLSGLGAKLVLDRCSEMRTDWVGLVRRGFDYAKVDAALLIEARPPGETSSLVRKAADAGIHLVATGIEREETVPDLLDFDVPLAQGHAIAPARPVRAEIVSGSPSAPEPSDPPPPPEARVPFRDFLRRAG